MSQKLRGTKRLDKDVGFKGHWEIQGANSRVVELAKTWNG